jgi:hypothetical protein
MKDSLQFHYAGPIGTNSYEEISHFVREKIKATIPSTKDTLKFSPIRDDAFCFTSTKNLWTKEGIFVYEDPIGESPFKTETLYRLHKEGNKDIRFVKYGFKTGKHSISEFIKNPLIIAQLSGDEEMIEQVAQRAKGIDPNSAFVINNTLNSNRFSQGLEKVVIMHTALDSYGVYGQALHIYCDIGNNVHGRIYGYMKEVTK